MTGGGWPAPDAAAVLAQWSAACSHRSAELSASEHAEPVVAALLAALAAGTPRTDTLDRAARQWAAQAGTVVPVVEQLAELRIVLHGLAGREPARCELVDAAIDQLVVTVTERALTEATDRARSDPLTGAGNRRALVDTVPAVLAAALRSARPLALVLFDVDGLKLHNDTQGHRAGDRALVSLAEGIEAEVRASDQVFRIGGDEFVAVLPVASTADVADVVARIARRTVPRFTWGAAVAPDDGTDVDTLLATADRRLYAVRAGQDAGARAEPLSGRAGRSGPPSPRRRPWLSRRWGPADPRRSGGGPPERPAPPA